jgi:tetratricopeptide (TPR) repeat protein
LLGIACCYDAVGRTNEAINAYKDLVDRHPNENVAPQARFSLARLYETQNMIEQARALYEDVAKADPNSSLGSEAGMRLEELKVLYPPPAPPPAPAPVITPIVTPETPPVATPAPTPGLLISNLPPPPAASTGAAPATPKP